MNKWQDITLLAKTHPIWTALLALQWFAIVVFLAPELSIFGAAVLATGITISIVLGLMLISSAFQ